MTTDELARAGYDLNEVKGLGNGKLGIVATPAQAQALRDKGATVKALSEARTMAAPPTPLTNPTHGYDVFRPWSLKPAACPTRCSTPMVPLKIWYHDLASRYPDLIKEETIGHSVLGQPIKAYKMTADARDLRDGARPVTLFESTQHAREWISAEVNRRLFQWFVDHLRDQDVKRMLNRNEVWFIPMMNPDGYDYTFTAKGTRLWRKNLRDVNGDHGSGPASEPEVQAARGLQQKLKPRFLIDYHSYAQLILYPEGWQVETEATDAPLMKALAGDDDHPAVPGFDPDVSAELYTTNGDVTGDAYNNWGTQAFTVELDGGTGAGIGGTVDGPDSLPPGGFVFQDTVGQDDWTTLPDLNGHASDDLSGDNSCPQIPITDEHPFMRHYVTLNPESSPGAGDATCTNGGTSGVFNGATGNSGGFVPMDFDLSAYAGRQVEISITYISDPGTQGLGVFVDDTKVTLDGATDSGTSFEDGLGGWAVPGAPEGSTGNANDWISTTSVRYVDGPGVATRDTLYWGFGLEGVTGADRRAQLVRDAMAYLGAG